MTNAQTLQTTPFHAYHLSEGAKMVDFAGWEMPLHYGSIIDEHHQVRKSGGLFDVSHMGRIRFTGKDACRLLDRLCTRQILGMADGQARYSLVCNEQGGCHDDVLVNRVSATEYLMVCNGANREKINNHIQTNKRDCVCKINDETESTAMLALQGPKVMDIISGVSSEVPNLKRYRFTTKNLLIASVMISRTGYTGEDGVEIILPKSFANKAVEMMLANLPHKTMITPAGLGARDSLRLEAGMPLYGHELTEAIDPIAAGLHFAVKLDKGIGNNEAEPFIGQEALQQIAKNGPKQKLVGLTLDGRRSPRQGMNVLNREQVIGEVTSGCFSPTFEKPIAMAYIKSNFEDDEVMIDFGRTQLPASVTKLPFYKR